MLISSYCEIDHCKLGRFDLSLCLSKKESLSRGTREDMLLRRSKFDEA